jgi:hypothetical protein
MRDDELVQRMDRDDLVDKAFFYGLMPVREFARLMQVAPQLIYYRLRTKKLQLHTCETCGREGLVNVEDGIRTFRTTPQDVQEAEEARRGELATDVTAFGSDEEGQREVVSGVPQVEAVEAS